MTDKFLDRQKRAAKMVREQWLPYGNAAAAGVTALIFPNYLALFDQDGEKHKNRFRPSIKQTKDTLRSEQETPKVLAFALVHYTFLSVDDVEAQGFQGMLPQMAGCLQLLKWQIDQGKWTLDSDDATHKHINAATFRSATGKTYTGLIAMYQTWGVTDPSVGKPKERAAASRSNNGDMKTSGAKTGGEKKTHARRIGVESRDGMFVLLEPADLQRYMQKCLREYWSHTDAPPAD